MSPISRESTSATVSVKISSKPSAVLASVGELSITNCSRPIGGSGVGMSAGSSGAIAGVLAHSPKGRMTVGHGVGFVGICAAS